MFVIANNRCGLVSRSQQTTVKTPNKDRLYIAFYSKPTATLDSFHTALLITPKRPNPKKVQTWRYHVRENARNSGDYHRWEYEGGRIGNGDPERRLVALVHLCKMASGVSNVELSVLFQDVEISSRWDDGGDRDWITRAIELLTNRRVIGEMALSLQMIWSNGYRFAGLVEGNEERVPTCDIYGRMRKSEVRREWRRLSQS
ncbi:hypothetical protein JAAARDRAFT_62399 [Jaapia argillacea MUCL 33604]|uniref:Uncharacterized protein n=1 Tax=Jaapia argillacea MUCL 33604 TaxID=933084 RepID=A0A067PKZ8_9AGAM|nr:hypothetical protein JAAARDRAFT_62399 [Jaapia argillacea MUCL 33604]